MFMLVRLFRAIEKDRVKMVEGGKVELLYIGFVSIIFVP